MDSSPSSRLRLAGLTLAALGVVVALLILRAALQREPGNVHAIRALALADLRHALAMVAQEPVLFAGTIRDNIAYGRAGATAAEVEQAARDAYAHDFIAGFPDGYDTKIGERGTKLSGGQKQRIALARALLADPRVLILDEATSALDAESEAAVQAALARLMRGRTTIIVAHRLSTVQGADRIVVIEDARVVEQGRHDELMARGGHYAELYNTYFRHQSPDYRPPEAPAMEPLPEDPHALPDPQLLPADYLV